MNRTARPYWGAADARHVAPHLNRYRKGFTLHYVNPQRRIVAGMPAYREAFVSEMIADDAETNAGRMFGRDTVAFFTRQGEAVETYADDGPHPTEPGARILAVYRDGETLRYAYYPSTAYGGKRDRADFVFIGREGGSR